MKQIQLTLEQKDRSVIALSLIIFLLVGLVFFINNREPDVMNYPTNRDSIIVFGDSLAEGIGSSDGTGFVSELEGLVNRDIEQYGVSGDTTERALQRLDKVIDQKPGIVIISLGGNDFIQGVPKDEMRQDYNKIISRLQNGGSIVMILGVPGYTYSYSGLARDHKVSYVSNILRGVITNPDLMSDPIHPNDAGYSKIANRIAPELRRLITY